MPNDSLQLRDDLLACLPSLVIDRPLAESGQRVVYLARFDDSLIPDDVPPPEDDDPDAKPFLHGWQDWGDIVVKVVSGADSETIARLQAEADILGEVRPTNFPRLLYDNLFYENPVTEERLAERLYVTVEEFIVSKPLNAVIDQYRGNEDRVLDVAIGIAEALLPLWMHPKRFVHRDIKPANVLIRKTGEVVVIDLGIARETGAKGVTKTGFNLAPYTLGFAAPEQIENEKTSITFKTDLFTIGVLMYLLLSGIKPFEPRKNMHDFEILLATKNDNPPPLSQASGASAALSDFIEKAMQKEPFKRHRTPALFIQELRELRGRSTPKN